jgi:hypothetical protein
LLQQIISKEVSSRTCVRLDCSNDELLTRAMEAVLKEKFPEEGKNSLLVADEFHMLSKEHKEQLFHWISERLHWLKVVFIANRSNGKSYNQSKYLQKQSMTTI